MSITLNGSTGITGVTNIASASANTAVVLTDSSANSNTCRAWVNFNGTGTVAINGSFNVSSITDNGTGLFTINFTTALPDANYIGSVTANGTVSTATADDSLARTTTALRIRTFATNATAVDSAVTQVAIFR